DEPSLIPWQMLLTLVPDPLRWSVGAPHADSSKTSLELSFRSGAPSDVPPSAIGQHVFSRHREDVRNVPLTGTAASGNRPDHLHIGRVYLEVPRDIDCPNQFASREPLAERRAQPITGIRQDAAKAYAGRDGTIDLRQSHLRFRSCRSIFGRNTRSLQPSPLAGPTLGKKQPQSQHDRHFASRQRQRYKGLAVGGLAERRSILRSHTHRMRALLGNRGVVDHQNGIAATNEPIRLDKQLGFHRRRIPGPGSDEVVQLISPAELINTITFEPKDEPQIVWSRGDVEVSAIRSTHIAGHVSYRVDTPAASVVIGGDAGNDVPLPPRSSSASEQVERLAKAADVIVHSTIHPIMGPDKGSGFFPHAYFRQSNAFDLGAMAKRAGAKYLMLTHMIPPLGAERQGPFTIPRGRVTEADYRKAVEESGFTGKVIVGTDLITLRLPAK